MISYASLQQPRKMFASDQLLLGAELQGIWRWQLPRQLSRHRFRRLPTRCENQDRSQILRQCFGYKSRPVSTNVARNMIIEIIRMNLLERHWPQVVPDQD